MDHSGFLQVEDVDSAAKPDPAASLYVLIHSDAWRNRHGCLLSISLLGNRLSESSTALLITLIAEPSDHHDLFGWSSRALEEEKKRREDHGDQREEKHHDQGKEIPSWPQHLDEDSKEVVEAPAPPDNSFQEKKPTRWESSIDALIFLRMVPGK